MITIYDQAEENFATLGLGALNPTECDVDWEEGGQYDLTMKHPILDDGKWMSLTANRIIRAPSPVRESPEVEITAGETTTGTISRQIYKVKTPAGGRLNLRKKPSTSSKVLGSYKPGTLIVKTGASGNWTKVLLLNGGRSGWMYTDYITYVRTETETVTTQDKPGVIIRRTKALDQLFRINVAEPDTTNGIVNVEAEHISYDLKWVKVIGKCELKNMPVEEALEKVQSLASREHDFEIHCLVNGNVSGDYTNKSLLECIRDPEIGFAPQLGARVVCDNFDVWILPDEERDMGVELRYRKNLKGVKFKTDSSNQVSRIYPVGRDKDGDPLYLDGTKYVESAYADAMLGRDAAVEYDVKVGTGEGEFKTNAAARSELARLARADMEKGADMALFSMSVDFLDLGETEEYKQYEGLMIVHPYDTVTVIRDDFGRKEKARLNKCKWDSLLARYKSTTFGSVVTAEATIYSHDIVPGTINSRKMAAGSVGTAQLRNLSIQYAKIAQAAIDQLAANAITAVRAHINELVAGSVTTDELYAALATIAALEVANAEIDYAQIKDLTAEVARIADARIQNATITTAQIQNLNAFVAEIAEARIKNATITTAQIQNLNAFVAQIADAHILNATIKSAQIDDLQAVMLQAITANIATANIDYAQIRDLLADQAIITDGVGKSLLIERLFVTQANMLGATLGQLILKGSDGNYYKVVVQSDGTISTELASVTDGEIVAGQTGSGLQIVETDMNVASLNAQNIRAQSAIIAEIFTQALTAGKITASEALIASATVPLLYATAIQAIGNSLDLSANDSIRMIVGRKNATLYREEAPTEFNSGDTWIRPSDGKTFLARGMTGKNAPELAVDDDFMLSYRFGEDADEYALMMDEEGNLLATDANAQITDEGDLETTAVWMEIAPSELHTSFISILKDMIAIYSGGNIHINAGAKLHINTEGEMDVHSGGTINVESGGDVNVHAGGALNVDSGAAHFRTGEYTLSILADDGSEDTVMDFDAEGKTLRVTELKAGNMRQYIPGTTEVSSVLIGGLDGLKGLLEASQYEHIVYTHATDDYSAEPVQINGCDSLQVEIVAALPTRVPPLAFTRTTGNVYMENLVWNCAGQTAMTADSGSYVLRDCQATAATGVKAVRHARIAWIGADETATDGGTCTTAFEATEGGEIRAFGLIPSGAHVQTLAGVVTVTDSSTGDGGTTEEEEQTVTLTGTLGYYGTSNGWNSGVMYQGYSNGKGRIYGCMKFTLPEGVTAVKAATLTLRRVSGAGSGSNINVSVYGSATAYGSRPTLGSLYAEREKAAATGASCTLDVTQAAQALADGTAKQLVLWTGETAAASGVVYSRHYGKFDSAKLKITY